MNYQKFILKILAFFIAGWLTYSCTGKVAPLRLVYPNKVNYESFIIARHNGYFKEDSNNINIQTVNSGIRAAEALNTGGADVIAAGNGPAVILMAQNKEVVIVTRYATGERMHRLVADTSIHSIQELVGKRIGVQQGSSTHAALIDWLDNNGISTDQITIVPMDPLNMPEAMKSKQLDAIAGSEPWPLNVEKLCKQSVHQLSDLYDPNNTQSHVVITTRKILNEHKLQIEDILAALEEANQFIVNDPQQSAEIVSKYTNLTIDDQKICTARLTWKLGWEESDVQSLEQTADYFYKLKSISEVPDIQEYIAKGIKY
jgi:sulfonate transport system substrate-binding protein